MNNLYAAHWTTGSIYCYERGCNCQGCYMNDILESRCKMKCAVFELVRKFGKLKEENELELSVIEQEIVNIILAGANTLEEIAQKLKKSKNTTGVYIRKMYSVAKNDGVVFKNGRNMLPRFIEWVRKGK